MRRRQKNLQDGLAKRGVGRGSRETEGSTCGKAVQEAGVKKKPEYLLGRGSFVAQVSFSTISVVFF